MQNQQPVICVRYRAAWPSLPRLPLDFSRSYLPSSIFDDREAIQDRVHRILKNNKILEPQTEIDLVVRRTKPTILIKSPWDRDSKKTWAQTVEQIVAAMKTEFPRAIKRNLHVEMIAPQCYETVYIGEVEDNDLLWDDIQAVVKRHLDSSQATRNHLSTLALIRRGFSKPEDNPITVYIGCTTDSDETKWEGIADAMEAEFCERGWKDVVVHIEHNTPIKGSCDRGGDTLPVKECYY
ncbi:hypothetical protein FBEOM_10459 [Fusarium beomiforme]|uniref:Uncharacterized protein n=1 Tax=Fusarium beomiforme TaxID=44412 RepID=A0A9P5DSE5_9HYPO|nr:hypothetical protein FBEOM_10459 [Fusarium beomiforme]